MEVGSTKTLSHRVAKELKITKFEAKHIVKVVFDALIEEIIEKKLVQLNGYFSFKIVKREGNSFGNDWSVNHLKVTVSDNVKSRFN